MRISRNRIDFEGGRIDNAALGVAYRAITTTDTVGTGDRTGIVRITGASSFTLAFSAVATLGAGAWGIIEHTGTGEVTLDPDSTEQIDGLTTWKLYAGGVILWQCNGSGFTTRLLAPMTATFLASGTFTKPGCGSRALVTAWGAGGSGGRENNAYGRMGVWAAVVVVVAVRRMIVA